MQEIDSAINRYASVGLTIHFENETTATPNGLRLHVDRTLPPFDLTRMTVIDWSGINIKKESQGPGRDSDSVQARVVKHIRGLEPWDLVIDDDGTGEVADIVAIAQMATICASCWSIASTHRRRRLVIALLISTRFVARRKSRITGCTTQRFCSTIWLREKEIGSSSVHAAVSRW